MMNGWIVGDCMDRWMNGWINRQKGGKMSGWMDPEKEEQKILYVPWDDYLRLSTRPPWNHF